MVVINQLQQNLTASDDHAFLRYKKVRWPLWKSPLYHTIKI